MLLQGKPIGEETLKRWLVQLLLAVAYMHQERIIHRDIKAANVFITAEDNINVGDFGLATRRNGENGDDYSLVGTPPYMSPELISGCPYDYKTDIW